MWKIFNFKKERRLNYSLLVPVEEVQTKFKSKLDLYTVMSVDSKHLSIIMIGELFSSSVGQISSCFLLVYPQRWKEGI